MSIFGATVGQGGVKSLEEELAVDPETEEDVGEEEEGDGWGEEEEDWGEEAAAAAVAPLVGSAAEKMAGKKSLRRDASLGNKKKGGSAGEARVAAPAEKPRTAMMYPMVFPGLFPSLTLTPHCRPG